MEDQRTDSEEATTATEQVHESGTQQDAIAAEQSATVEVGGEQHLEAQIDDPKSVELSSEFIGRWTTLISTTNWEKGKIIYDWREALMGSESPAAAYSDEAWSRRVGGVTPQHVGRLRRVFDRFGSIQESFSSLYWSHFLAALDWDDAEMWLEGATQSKWSVSQMRRMRWEASGGDPSAEPKESEIVSLSDDEDYTPLAEVDSETGVKDDSRSIAEGPRPEDPDFGDEGDVVAAANGEEDDDSMPWEEGGEAVPADSPFMGLPSLPVDISDALEQFKLAVIRHRADSWAEVDQADVVKAIDALRTFAMR